MEDRVERIACDDVQVGDRISRTRGGTYQRVERIEECPVVRWLIFGKDPCPEPELKQASGGRPWPRSGGGSAAAVMVGYSPPGAAGTVPKCELPQRSVAQLVTT